MIENTSKLGPLDHFVGMLSGSDEYITGMEAAGQQQLVDSSVLPADGPWPELEALGFVRGEPVDGDDLFVHAKLPEGWKKEATDHSMWSKVADERGIERVSVFYKAAFYDRRAFCHINDIGHRVVMSALYRDGAVKLPDFWDLLTDTEKAECAKALADALANELDKRKYFTLNPEGMKISDEHIAHIKACMALWEPVSTGGAE